MKKTLLIATLVVAGTLSAVGTAGAQVAGSTSLGVAVAEMTEVMNGWSVKKTILGKNVYNDAGEKVGKVEDLIISTDKNVSYFIVGAGGFVGMGRHDVAIPVVQIREKDGKIVIPGATKEILKALPRFEYAVDTTKRDQFVAKAEQDIAKGKAKVADLEKKSSAATSDVKVKLDQQITGLKKDVQTADDKMAEMNRAGAKRWKEFEGDVNAATAKVRKWIETAAG